MDREARHLVGLLLGTEDDWPRAFTSLLSGQSPHIDTSGKRHIFEVERVRVEPFSLRDKPRPDLVIDRLAYQHYHPREWLKKVALIDDVYLLNSPFTFQSMEKHAAYCAMMRLGLKVPETVLVPYKNPVDHATDAYTADRYNEPFDLDDVAARIGFPLYMKPYDGGAWRGVTRIDNAAELHTAYAASGEMSMHLQASVEGYDVFVRALTIGAETMVMRVDPDRPMHERYRVQHGFLDPKVGREVVSISRTINAFFRWEFNSCEVLVRDGEVYPIDYANACPDVSLTSLHYYFPWAMKALVKWTMFCLATGRKPAIDLETRSYFDVGDRADLRYDDKLTAYRELSDAYFDIDHYHEFCADELPHLDDRVLDWVQSADFERLLWDTVRSTYPPHEHEQFVAHFRGLVDLWVADESGRLGRT